MSNHAVISVSLVMTTAAILVFSACSRGSSQSTSTEKAGSLDNAGELLVDPGSPGRYQSAFKEIVSGEEVLQLWYPTTVQPAADADVPTDTTFPLIVFDANDESPADRFAYLSEHLASWGFVVAALRPSAATEHWTSGTTAVLATIDDLKSRPSLDHEISIIDASRVGAIGASSSASDALAANTDPRIRAVTAMAVSPATLEGTGQLRAPSLLMFSGKDELVGDELVVRTRFAAIDAGVTHYLLYFPDGVHESYFDTCSLTCSSTFTQQRAHELVERYTAAFAVAYVAGDTRYARDLAEPPKEQEEEEDDPPDSTIIHAGP